MKTKSNIAKVTEFMLAFGQEIPKEPYINTPPPLEVRKLRAKLILEEALETIRALGLAPLIINPSSEFELDVRDINFEEHYDYNFLDVLDGLCDLEYVASAGTSVALGISEELYEKAFDLVHENNMTKLWTGNELIEAGVPTELIEQKEFKWITQGTLCVEFNAKRTGKGWLVKDQNGKVIKSPSHKPVDLSILLK